MENNDGFIPILAVFYSVFHPTEGTKIIHQVPEGSIISNNSKITDNSLFNFDSAKNYIIPKPQLCNKLISFKIDKFRVLGFPVNIENGDYSRNSFNFNFGFVFPYDSDTTPYEPAIKRMGKMFRVLEEQSFILSKLDKKLSFYPRDENSKVLIPSLISGEFNNNSKTTNHNNNNNVITPGHSRIKKINLSSIESLIHQIYQDLNNYSECCIPLDSANSVDIKLFPILPPPVNIKAFQVPVSTVKLNSLVDVNWDPTMLKILPYINGINSIKRISELANSDYLLTKQCIQHLMHYKCINIVDIFQFSNIYAPTNKIGNFLKLNGMAEECQSYIITDNESYTGIEKDNGREKDHNFTGSSISPYTKTNYLQQLSGSQSATNIKPKIIKSIKVPSKSTLFFLYRSLNQGQTIKEWYIQHRKQLIDIDIRRFINFGMLRGIIYRVYSYPIISSFTKSVEKNMNDELDELMELIRLKRIQTQRKKKNTNKNKKRGLHRSDSVIRRKSSGGGDNDKKLLKNMVNVSNITTLPNEGRSDNKSNRKVNFDYLAGGLNRFNIIKDIIDETSDDESSESSFQSEEQDDRSTINLKNFKSTNGNNAIESSSEDESDEYSDNGDNDEEDENTEMIKLIKLLKGYQTLDCICTELQKPRVEIESMLDQLGSYSIING